MRNYFGPAVFSLFILAVFYFGFKHDQEADRLAKAAEIQKITHEDQMRNRQKSLDAFVEGAKDDSYSAVSRAVSSCEVKAESSSAFDVFRDYKDHNEVSRLLRNLNPYDVSAKIDYVSLPERLGDVFYSSIVSQIRENSINQNGTSEFTFSVTYKADSFSGLKDAWGLLTCTMTGASVSSATLETLYVE